MTESTPSRKYERVASLAKGGMGEVFEARDLVLKRIVAMKVMLEGMPLSEKSRQRFIREAEVLAQLDHPNIVPIHDLGLDENGQVFYTMKLVRGTTLKCVLEALRDGDSETVKRYPLPQLLTVLQKICDAIAFAHSRGIIHRDLKPANIMLGSFGEVLVMDWGLARILAHSTVQSTTGGSDDQPSKETQASATESSPQSPVALTLPGQVLGTPTFMAPEQATGKVEAMDERTDVFALGAILYNILSLRVPIWGTTVEELLDRVKGGSIAPPIYYNDPGALEPDGIKPAKPIILAHCPGHRVPASLSAVAMKAMALRSEDRYQSVAALQNEIAAYQGGYATLAEQASFWKQLLLLVRRHRKEFGLGTAGLLALGLIASAFMGRLWQEKQRTHHALQDAQHILVQLQQTAPSHYNLAMNLVAERKFNEALEKIEFTATLKPENAAYQTLRGNLLQYFLRFEEAIQAYGKVLKLDPHNSLAATNLELCRRLLAKGSPTNLARADLLGLSDSMLHQGRVAESLALTERVSQSEQEIFEACWMALEKLGLSSKLTRPDQGILHLDLSGNPMSDLRPLRGLPITSLNLSGCTNLLDLDSLRGMPLRGIDLYHTSIRDLAPLKGMPLQWLTCYHSGVYDLSPLEGMPLTDLNVSFTAVRDISPLQVLTNLASLSICGLPVEDLEVLRGRQLQRLWILLTKVRDLSPLKSMPLWELDLGETRVTDLSPLAGMPLRNLLLKNTRVSDIRVLKGMPLEQLDLSRTDITDLEALRGLPLKTLRLDGCSLVRDLTPLTECLQLENLTVPSTARNLDGVRHLPNLRRLGLTLPNDNLGNWDRLSSPAEFFKAWDARRR